eukprot:Awhi_evm1s11669
MFAAAKAGDKANEMHGGMKTLSYLSSGAWKEGKELAEHDMEQIKFLFATLDLDGSGDLDPEELVEFVSNLHGVYDVSSVDELMTELDTNND